MNYKINTNHKDRLFCFLFGNEKYKQNALSLYNALNGSSYSKLENLEITTIQDVIYIQMHNDVSFLVDNNMNLYEQQSTFNPNMPIRGFLYFAKLYDKYIESNRINLYGHKLAKLPTPKYVVFYNGTEERPAEEKLRLSDAFANADPSGEFQWTATMVNLNHPDKKELLDKCEPLHAYTKLMAGIRSCQGMDNYEAAVDNVIKGWIEKGGILAEILLAHRAEVVDMVLTEFNEEVFVKGIREEGWEEGLEKGREEGRKEGLAALIKSLHGFVNDPAELHRIITSNKEYQDVTPEEVERYLPLDL